MSNRVYLSCTGFQSLPKPDQWEAFFKQSGVEYEANACIPIFWLCLFSAADVRIVPSDHNGFDDDWHPYAYLMGNREAGIERLRARAPMMKAALGELRFSLYSEWLSRMETETYENILVRTEELDWMGEDGELETTLRKAMQHLEKVSAEGSMRMSHAMNDIAGLWSQEVLNKCESYELVGAANTTPRWPLPFVPRPESTPPVILERKPWWAFWR